MHFWQKRSVAGHRNKGGAELFKGFFGGLAFVSAMRLKRRLLWLSALQFVVAERAERLPDHREALCEDPR